MALINMSKHFYYLRRVSGNGLADNGLADNGLPNKVEICGTEYDSGQSWNYVVDTDAEQRRETSMQAILCRLLQFLPRTPG